MAEFTEPKRFPQAAEALRQVGAAGRSVRFRGGGTKAGCGASGTQPSLEISSGALDRVVQRNAGDLTAVLEAGVRLAEAQQLFASNGQMFALDPPLGDGDGATVGGVVATGDWPRSRPQNGR